MWFCLDFEPTSDKDKQQACMYVFLVSEVQYLTSWWLNDNVTDFPYHPLILVE